MDPNGLYIGNSDGTYVVCINPQGKAEIQYAEPNVHAVGGPARWNMTTHQIEMTGAPTVAVKIGK